MTKALVIGKKAKQKLNKQQQTFNRLVKKLENLRTELEQTSQRLSQQLDYFSKHIHPLEQELTTLRQESVKLFYKFHQDKKLLSKKDRKALWNLIAAQLSSIFQLSDAEPDAEIKEIFAAVEGVSYDQSAEEDFAAMKDDMAETFKQFGLEVDLDDFHAGMSEEEMIRRMMGMVNGLKEQAEAAQAARPQRKKSVKQLANEAREEQAEALKGKTIASIYKQLARALHPDLEQDPQVKIAKEDLMKELTTAYEKGDLHTLLRLEMAWIHKEEGNLEKLSDEKLAIYNQSLKQQVEELQGELFMLFRHPRYQPLVRLSPFPGSAQSLDLEIRKRELQESIREATQSITALKGENPVKELKEILSFFKQPEPNFFEISLEDLFR